MYFLLIHNCLTKSDPFWVAGRSNTGSSRVSSAPLLARGCSSLSARGWPQLYTSARECWAVSRRQLQDLKLLRCPMQSKAGLVVELQHMQASCPACSNKNLLTVLPRLCSKRLCLTREKGFEYSELCCCGDVDDSRLVCGLTPNCHGTKVTHMTPSDSCSYPGIDSKTARNTPTLTSHGKAVGLSHVLKWLVD